MMKAIATVLVSVTAVAALSACEVEQTGTAAGTKDDSIGSMDSGGGAKSGPSYTIAQENAIQSAQSYLDMSGFSRAGLIQQLSSKAGEGYKLRLAVFAVNHIKVNWNKEAVESAKSYLEMGGFSRASLIQQLSSKAGEQFTHQQAVFAANHVGL